MTNKIVNISEESAAIILSPEMLKELGVNVGDDVDVSIVNRTLLVRSLDEAARARKIEEATQTIFERRRSAYQELAEGAE